MKITVRNLRALNRAALDAAGLRRGSVEVGIRVDRREDGESKVTHNCLYQHSMDVAIGDLYDVNAVTKEMLVGPVVMDLYVYDSEGELVTNVAAICDAEGQLLACFDSVTRTGMERLSWWLEGTDCTCHLCKE